MKQRICKPPRFDETRGLFLEQIAGFYRLLLCLLAPGGALLQFEVLRLAKRGNALHELQRKGLIERKLHRALAEFVAAKLLCKGGDSLRAGVEADVVRKRGEVDDVAVQVERRHAVRNLLRGFGEDLYNRVAHLVQFGLYLRRGGEDVVGDGGGHNHNFLIINILHFYLKTLDIRYQLKVMIVFCSFF